MITKILRLVEDAEGVLWPDDFDNSPLTNIENIDVSKVVLDMMQEKNKKLIGMTCI